MTNIAFLFDKTNDWLSQYLPKDLVSSKKFNAYVFFDEDKVRGFDLVLFWAKVLKGEILSSNKLLLVIHESDLPNGRGLLQSNGKYWKVNPRLQFVC